MTDPRDNRWRDRGYVPPRSTPGHPLSSFELATLIALVEAGPLRDVDMPSKSGRDSLLVRGMAVRVIVRGADLYTAATYAGRDAYCDHFGGGTIEEARAMRLARTAIRRARR